MLVKQYVYYGQLACYIGGFNVKDISLPKKWLIHDVEYIEYVGSDDYSNPIYSDGVVIQSVRVDESTTFSRDATQNKIESNAVIFVDTKHSAPILDYKEESKVIFKDKEMTIKKVIPFYFPESDRIRHFEIEVI